MDKYKKTLLNKTLIAALLASALATAQAEDIRAVAGKAVTSHPEVLAKWHQFKASVHERDISRGRYLPTLDIIFGTAYQKQESPLFIPPGSERRYNFQTAKATLRQNLFEGFATENDARRLEHASMVRFYEMLDLSETAALEAVRAYIDVYRYRKLVEFAEENYATHRVAYEKIKERAASGVGRRVDLETAAGRLALAESNLLTETSNLHDVTARYQRIVGEPPKADLDAPPPLFGKALPKDRNESVQAGFGKSPQLKAALENILSAKRNVEVQKAGYYPRVDAYLEHEHDSNLNGYNARTGFATNSTNIQTAGITVSWNLFNGRRDLSRERRAIEEVNAARDSREKVCRDLRQNLAIAFNDHLRLSEQLQYLDQHQLSTDKAREAFRRQFDIGQRTLLDVLDTENEYYTARRNYLNGEMDLEIARARYLAAAGGLLKALDLQPLDIQPLHPEAQADDDTQQLCPPEPPIPYTPKKEVKAGAGEQFILLPEAGGKVGEITVAKDGGGEARLNQPYTAAQVGATGVEVRQTSESEVKARYQFLVMSEARSYTVLFPLGKSTPLASSRQALKTAIDASLKDSALQVAVIGHSDKVGNAANNLALSQKRAEAVRQQLIAGGVPAARIETRWQGDKQPLPDTRANDQRNRRVEIRLQQP